MKNSMLKKVICLVVTSAFLVNNFAYGLSPMPASVQPEVQDRICAGGEKLFAAKRPDILDLEAGKPLVFTPLKAPQIDGVEFVKADYKKPPKGWANNPILQKTDIIEALRYFRDNEAKIPAEFLDIREGYFPVKDEELPIARLEPIGNGRWVLIVDTRFVQMWNHIRAHDVWFTSNDRPVSAAWGIFYRLAKHEMTDLTKSRGMPKSLGHVVAYAPDLIPELKPVIIRSERIANSIKGRYIIVNDAVWMWFLGSYCIGDLTRYDNDEFLKRAGWFFDRKDTKQRKLRLWREFPNLVKDKKTREYIIELASAMNYHFFSRANMRVPALTVDPKYIAEYKKRERARKAVKITTKPISAASEASRGKQFGANAKGPGALERTNDSLIGRNRTFHEADFHNWGEPDSDEGSASVRLRTGQSLQSMAAEAKRGSGARTEPGRAKERVSSVPIEAMRSDVGPDAALEEVRSEMRNATWINSRFMTDDRRPKNLAPQAAAAEQPRHNGKFDTKSPVNPARTLLLFGTYRTTFVDSASFTADKHEGYGYELYGRLAGLTPTADRAFLREIGYLEDTDLAKGTFRLTEEGKKEAIRFAAKMRNKVGSPAAIEQKFKEEDRDLKAELNEMDKALEVKVRGEHKVAEPAAAQAAAAEEKSEQPRDKKTGQFGETEAGNPDYVFSVIASAVSHPRETFTVKNLLSIFNELLLPISESTLQRDLYLKENSLVDQRLLVITNKKTRKANEPFKFRLTHLGMAKTVIVLALQEENAAVKDAARKDVPVRATQLEDLAADAAYERHTLDEGLRIDSQVALAQREAKEINIRSHERQFTRLLVRVKNPNVLKRALDLFKARSDSVVARDGYHRAFILQIKVWMDELRKGSRDERAAKRAPVIPQAAATQVRRPKNIDMAYLARHGFLSSLIGWAVNESGFEDYVRVEEQGGVKIFWFGRDNGVKHDFTFCDLFDELAQKYDKLIDKPMFRGERVVADRLVMENGLPDSIVNDDFIANLRAQLKLQSEHSGVVGIEDDTTGIFIMRHSYPQSPAEMEERIREFKGKPAIAQATAEATPKPITIKVQNKSTQIGYGLFAKVPTPRRLEIWRNVEKYGFDVVENGVVVGKTFIVNNEIEIKVVVVNDEELTLEVRPVLSAKSAQAAADTSHRAGRSTRPGKSPYAAMEVIALSGLRNKDTFTLQNYGEAYKQVAPSQGFGGLAQNWEKTARGDLEGLSPKFLTITKIAGGATLYELTTEGKGETIIVRDRVAQERTLALTGEEITANARAAVQPPALPETATVTENTTPFSPDSAWQSVEEVRKTRALPPQPAAIAAQLAARDTETAEHPLVTAIRDTDIMQFVVPTGRNVEPGVVKLSRDDLKNCWQVVNLMDENRIEILMPQRFQAGLTDTMKQALRDIEKRRGADTVKCVPFSGEEHLATLLARPSASGVKRIVLTEEGSSVFIRELAQDRARFFNGVRVLNVALPYNYASLASNEKTFCQARIILTAILARLYEKGETQMVEYVLTRMLTNSVNLDENERISDFLDKMAGLKDENADPDKIRERIKYCLDKTVSLVAQVARAMENIRLLMKEVWSKA